MIQKTSKVEEKAKWIISQYKAGIPIADIAAFIGVTPRCVADLLSGKTFKGKYKVRELTTIKNKGKIKSRGVYLYVGGNRVKFTSASHLAKALGVSPDSILDIIRGNKEVPQIEGITYD